MINCWCSFGALLVQFWCNLHRFLVQLAKLHQNCTKTTPKIYIFLRKNLCFLFKLVDIVGKTDWFVQTNVWLFHTNDDLNFDLIDFSGKIFQNSPHLH